MSERESMPYDVVIVGAGPAGLAAAIRLKQLANAAGSELSVCILEKGSEVGAHILSGAVMDPSGLTELIPDWRERGAPVGPNVTKDVFHVLTRRRDFRQRCRSSAADDQIGLAQPPAHVIDERLDVGPEPRCPVPRADELHVPFSGLVNQAQPRAGGGQPRRCLHHGQIDRVRALGAAKD